MAVAGALEVQMYANLARLTSDMREAKNTVGGAMTSINNAVQSTKSVLASLGLGIGVGALGLMAKNAIDVAASLDDMSESTGASVAELSKLSQQAKISGADMTAIEATLQRLARSLNGTDEESKKATRALDALGLKADDLRGKDTAQSLKIVADAMNQFGDSSGKTALAMDLLGKSGAQMLPFLKDLANDAELAASVTAEQAAQAEELEKVLRRLGNDFDVLKQAMILGALPGIFEWIDANKEALRIGGSVSEMLRLFVFNLEAMTTEKPGEQIRRLTKEIAELGEEVNKPWWKQGAMSFFFGEQDIKDKQKQIEFLKFLQRQEALAMGGGDTRGEQQRYGLAGAVKPKLDYDPDNSPDAQRARDAANAKRIAEMERAEKERERHLQRLQKIDNDHWVRVIDEQFRREADEAMRENDKAMRKLEKTERDLESLRVSLLTEEELESESYTRRLDALIRANDAGILADWEMMQMKERMELQHQSKLLDIEMKKNDAQQSMEQATWQAGVNLLRAFAGESKIAAVAIIGINTALSISQAMQATAVATMRAFADLGPIAGAPAAAAIQTMGAIQVGLIAAAGALQIGGALGGGGGAGMAGISGLSSPPGLLNPTPITQAGQEQQTQRRDVVIQINTSRSIFSRTDLEEIMTGMNEIAQDGFPTRFRLDTA